MIHVKNCSTRWIQKQYNNPDMFILENGWSDQGELEDNDRVKYMHDHLHQIQEIVLNNECNLKGYAGTIPVINYSKVFFCFQYFY